MTTPELEIIAKVRSPFQEKFGIPRQPRLADAALADIVFEPTFNNADFISGIEQHSHIWLLFLFHQNLEQGYKPLVRPPRLGGNEKLGVFATRSTFRPNGIGMSAVKLMNRQIIKNQLVLTVEGADLLSGTPIIDIKPYIPYSDSITDAHSELVQQETELLTVNFSELAQSQLARFHSVQYPKLSLLIEQVLQQDPRPAYKKQKHDDKEYGIRLYDLNIKWRVQGAVCVVMKIEQEG